MTSIFAAAMGEELDRLHPMLQRRFGVGLDAGYDGTFTCEFVPATDAPERLKPRRHEVRV
ncbi:hypothetical protein PYV02_04055 [Leifsonia sp. H3M29-4]|uniref:hypothetical protein n=1 Tax=Salinibacterium metalliresistens TaxID=3031321 RepID=UPI0023DB0510|nr:hypothetical protein [Salinibacterium metalliresistens]MDF1478249.1 hypothetical protein [Salinibacterium metalliresistens]